MEPIRVYVAGPYTNGDVAQNVRQAIDAGDTLFSLGFYPYIPHLTHFWHLIYPRKIGDWLRLDLGFLEVCQALLRLGGKSRGADIEEARARELGLRVFYSLEALAAYSWSRG